MRQGPCDRCLAIGCVSVGSLSAANLAPLFLIARYPNQNHPRGGALESPWIELPCTLLPQWNSEYDFQVIASTCFALMGLVNNNKLEEDEEEGGRERERANERIENGEKKKYIYIYTHTI